MVWVGYQKNTESVQKNNPLSIHKGLFVESFIVTAIWVTVYVVIATY